MGRSRTLVLSLLMLAGAVLAIERAYAGHGLLDVVTIFSIALTLACGIALLWPRTREPR